MKAIAGIRNKVRFLDLPYVDKIEKKKKRAWGDYQFNSKRSQEPKMKNEWK